jgi:hypothetical protein
LSRKNEGTPFNSWGNTGIELTIESAEVSEDGKGFQATAFVFGREDKILGRPLTAWKESP